MSRTYRPHGDSNPGLQDENLPTSARKPCGSITYSRSDPDLVSCLVLLERIDPDLRTVVKAWRNIPQAVRAGILALIRATNETP